ncbi:MAG: acetate uptake transporter [Salinivirgaceae bacterium]
MNNKIGNPAVVGLAGFGLTTLLLQFQNLGWVAPGPIVAMAFAFGGIAQMIAGFNEQKVGNNFGYTAFVSYGAFWVGFGIILILNHFDIYASSTTDVGYYLVAWTLYTAILLVASLWVHKAMTVTFALLFAGFVLLDLEHFGYPQLKTPAAITLIFCAFSAWYMMAAILINDLSGRILLPLGKSFASKQ